MWEVNGKVSVRDVLTSVKGSGPQYQRFQISESQRRNCPSPISLQAPASAPTISASPLLSAIPDGFLLVAVMAHKPLSAIVCESITNTSIICQAEYNMTGSRVRLGCVGSVMTVTKTNCHNLSNECIDSWLANCCASLCKLVVRTRKTSSQN